MYINEITICIECHIADAMHAPQLHFFIHTSRERNYGAEKYDGQSFM